MSYLFILTDATRFGRWIIDGVRRFNEIWAFVEKDHDFKKK